MSNFPRLIPAFTAHVVIDAASSVGTVASGNSLTIVPFAVNEGGIKSEPNYPIQLDAVFLHGSDFIRGDPSGKQIRLDVNSYLKDKSGAVVAFKYTGIINVTEGVAAVLGGKPEAQTTPFGDAFTHATFETGDEELKGLELKVFVASGRFIVEGKKTTVEYKISEVASGN